MATAARNLPLRKGQAVLMLAEQFPSNYYAWQRLAEENGASLKIVPWPDDQDWTTAVLAALTSEVAIAALPHVQWSSGGRLDLVRIGQACRQISAALALDLTQSLGALPFSVREVQPDFAVAANYKWLMGPYTTGLLYVAPKWHGGIPLEENWIQRANARDFTSLPRIGYGNALMLVTAWGLLSLVVLTMIATTREVMMPGTWQKHGFLYRIADTPASGPEQPPPRKPL